MSFRATISAAALAALLAACSSGSDGGTGPSTDVAPVITVTGVTDGAQYDGPVNVSISVDRGTYSATLDSQPFSSGGPVAGAGPHTLVVSARNGSATSARTVGFSIRAAGRMLIIRMFDLGDNESGGGGDAILVTDSAAGAVRHALIDAGPQGIDASNPGYVAARLQALGVTRLDFLELTHAHADHYAGMVTVLNAIPVGRFVYNGQARNVTSYQAVVTTARARADSVVVPTVVRALPIGGDTVTFRVVPPLATFLGDPNAAGDELNEGSLGTALARGTFRMFFTGDGEVAANNRWRTTFAALSANLTALKQGHHGANNAVFDNGFNGTSSWLGHTRPQIVLVSSNGRSHPRQNALNALLGLAQTETYCTSVHGEITVRVTEAGAYTVQVQKNATLDCVPGSEATT